MEKILLKSYQPITMNSADELLSYMNLWKALCKKGIEYRDLFNGPLTTPIVENKLKDNQSFQQFRQEAKNRDFELHHAELVLMEALYPKDQQAYTTYLKAYQEASKHLLQHAKSSKETSHKTELYVAAIRKLTEHYPEAAFFYKLLEKHELIEAQEVKTEAFRRHFLYQKNEFVSAARELYLKHTEVLNDPKSIQFKELRSLLLSDNDLDYQSLNAIFPVLEKAGSDRTPMLKNTKTNHNSEYAKLQLELDRIDKELKYKSREIRSDMTIAERREAFTNISKLREQKEMLNYVSEQHYKKIDLLKKAGVSSRNWMSENLLDKKKAGKDALKVFFATTALTASKTLFYFATNQTEKIDPEKVQKELINGLIETGLTAVGTYLFGPLGGSFTKSIMPFFRDEPADPYMEEFAAIKNQLTEGFGKINTKLEAIGTQITSELNAVVSKLQAYQDLSDRYGEFLHQKDTVLSLMKKLELIHQRIYLERKTSIKELLNQLLEWDSSMQQEFIRLVSILYHEDFDLGKDLEEPSENSVCGLFMTYNTEKSVAFHETTRKLLNTCQGVEKLGDIYLELREKWFASLGAYLLFFKEGDADTQEYFQIYWNAFRDKNTFSENLTIETAMLKNCIIGPGNIALLERIERGLDTPSRQLDFLCGFGLETIKEKPEDPSLLYEYQFEDLYSHKGKFTTQKNKDFASRYVITDYTLESQAKCYYTVYTHQANEIPVPIHLHLRLLRKDNVGIFNFGNQTYYPARVINPETSDEMKNSLEAFFSYGNSYKSPLTLLHKYFQLPVKNYYLSVGVSYPFEEVKLELYYLENGINKVIETYHFPIKYTEKSPIEEVFKAFQFELRPKTDHRQASLEVIVDRPSDRMRGIVSIVVSDYEAMKKAGFSRGIEGISTYCLTMTKRNLVNGEYIYYNALVRTENLRPFTGNLLLAGDEFRFASKDRSHFTEVTDQNTGWRSYDNCFSLRAINHSDAWFVQFRIQYDALDRADKGSIFERYNYTNNYSGHIVFQEDGNLVMYDTADRPLAATNTNSSPKKVKVAYLSNEHKLMVVNIPNKETKTSWKMDPEIHLKEVDKRKNTNRLFSGSSMSEGFEHRIESENGAYYLEFKKEVIDSGSFLRANKYRFLMQLRKKGGELVENILKSNDYNQATLSTFNFYLSMQKDGNLVAYAQANERVLFATGTKAKENEGCVLCLTNEGKVFLAKPAERKIVKWLYGN